MTEYENVYEIELKEKKVCRFCLSQNSALTNIYSINSNVNSQVSLSMQIMACVSIEVSLKLLIKLLCLPWLIVKKNVFFLSQIWNNKYLQWDSKIVCRIHIDIETYWIIQMLWIEMSPLNESIDCCWFWCLYSEENVV